MKMYTKNKFWGGVSDGSSTAGQDSTNTYNVGHGLDFRSDPDKLTAHRKLAKESSTTVTDLIKRFREYNGEVYGYGDTGKLYKRTTGGTWSLVSTLSDSHGNDMEILDNKMYLATDMGLTKYSELDGTPAFDTDFLVSSSDEVDQYAETSGSTYAVPTSISETAANRKEFTVTQDTIAGVMLILEAKSGTAADTITVTIHDSSNVYITSKTYRSDSFGTVPRFVRFTTPGAPTLTVGATYHIHVTCSAGTWTVRTSTLNDLSTMMFYQLSYFATTDVDQRNDLTDAQFNSTGSTYSPATIINEDDEHRLTFTPTISQISAISLLINTVGNAGVDWTVTLHDALDRVLATKTIDNASLSRGRYKWTFDSPVTLIPDAEYHVHVTVDSTGGSPRLIAGTASDIRTTGYRTHYNILENDETYHIMDKMANQVVIGHGSYLATIDDAEVYTRERLSFPVGETVRAITRVADYLYIATWRGDAITEFSESRVYIWDGVSPTYNGFIDVKEGQVNALINSGDNELYIIAGTEGQIYQFDGRMRSLKKVKNVSAGKYIEIRPGAIANWQGITYFGIGGGDSTDSIRDIYGYGQLNDKYPKVISRDYTISTGQRGSTVEIGAIIGLNQSTFLVAWKDNTTYGVDNISTQKQAAVVMQDLRFDGGNLHLPKHSTTLSVVCEPIASGQSIVVQYRLNGDGAFTTLMTISTVDQYVKTEPINLDWHEMELYFTMNSTGGGVAPTLISYALEYEVRNEFQIDSLVV